MRPPVNAWPATENAQKVLFFAQLLIEMLSNKSHQSYRARSLDTMARLKEAELTIDDIRENGRPSGILTPIYEEIKESLNNDPIIKVLAKDKTHIVAEKINNIKIENLLNHKMSLISIKKNISDEYKKKLEEKIINGLNKKILLRELTSIYCTHLINIGYSTQHITDKVEESFFNAPIKRVGTDKLKTFLREFDEIQKSFYIYAAIPNNAGKYFSDILKPEKVLPSALPTEVKVFYKDKGWARKTHKFFKFKIDGLDEYRVAKRLDEDLASVSNLVSLFPKKTNMEYEKDFFVVRLRTNKYKRINFEEFLPSEEILTTKEIAGIRRYSKRIHSTFDPASLERFASSINMHALAKQSHQNENTLISLWSAIEILLSEPPNGMPRILHYTKLLTPCICLRYIKLQIIDTYEKLYKHYGRKFYSIVLEEEHKVDMHLKFSLIILLPENVHLVHKLMKLLENNPLAMHRLWTLNQNYSPKRLHSNLKAHEKRVEWQIQRIYRARNGLVHAGKVPTYLESIILNAEEYYQHLVTTLVSRAKKEHSCSNIDQLVCDIDIEYLTYREELNNYVELKAFTYENVCRIFDYQAHKPVQSK
jgi:hypothetical protein